MLPLDTFLAFIPTDVWHARAYVPGEGRADQPCVTRRVGVTIIVRLGQLVRTLRLLMVAVFVRAGGCLRVSPILQFRFQLLPESFICVKKLSISLIAETVLVMID